MDESLRSFEGGGEWGEGELMEGADVYFVVFDLLKKGQVDRVIIGGDGGEGGILQEGGDGETIDSHSLPDG